MATGLRKFSFSLLVLCAMFGFSSYSYAGGVEVKLISAVKQVAPGDTIKIAALFKMHDPWHLYWKYPGETGLPPRIKFKLPEGFKVSELAWPAPVQFTQPGGKFGFGYHHELLLTADLSVPKTAVPGPVKLEAKIKWLGCSPSMCAPGRKRVELEIPVGEKTVKSDDSLFVAWASRLPVKSVQPDLPLSVALYGKFSSAAKKGDYSLSVDWKKSGAKYENFVLDLPKGLKMKRTLNTAEGKTAIEIALQLEDDADVKDKEIEGVLTYVDSKGKVKGVSVPLILR